MLIINKIVTVLLIILLTNGIKCFYYDDYLTDYNDYLSNKEQIKVTFVENYLLKQDKLNKTVWIYEELPFNSTIAYLNSNTSLEINSIKTNNNKISLNLFKLKASNQSNLHFLIVNDRLDREKDDYYDIKIKDLNGNLIFIRICLIDINDNKPILLNNSSLIVNLLENRLYTNFYDLNAFDADIGLNGKIEFKLLNQQELFMINRLNGSIDLIKPFDYETIKQISLKIRLIDSSNSQRRLTNDYTLTINVLDQNDNQPYFKIKKTNYSIRVLKESNTKLGQVQAIDYDSNPKTKYLIWPSKFESFFNVEPYTGILRSTITFDYPTVFNFKIIAKDVTDYETNDECETCDSIDINVQIIGLNAQDPLVKIKHQNYLLDLSLIKDNNLSISLNESIETNNFYSLESIFGKNENDSDLLEELNYQNDTLKYLLINNKTLTDSLKNGLYMLNLKSDSIVNILVVNSKNMNSSNVTKINRILSKINIDKILVDIVQNDNQIKTLSTIKSSSLLNSHLILPNNYMIITIISVFLILSLLLIGVIAYKYSSSRDNDDIDHKNRTINAIVIDSECRKSSRIIEAPNSDKYSNNTKSSSLSSSSSNVLIIDGGAPPPTVGPIDDCGYFGSSDYSDNSSKQQRNIKTQTTNKYQTSSSGSSTTGDDASSHPSTSSSSPLFTVTNSLQIPRSISTITPSQQQQQQQQNITTAKVFFERFERIYNSNNDFNNDTRFNVNRNSITAYSYV